MVPAPNNVSTSRRRSLGAVKITPFRASAALIAAGGLVIGTGLLVGDSPTPTTTVAATQVDLEIVPHPGDGPEVVRGAPGSREQIAVFGGLVVALGSLGALGSYSAQAAARAREQRTAPREPVDAT
jgi:hypothetical protein